jgi:hypothetical protein
MKESEKNTYIPPTVEVNPVVLDANIALQSPIRNIEVQDWDQQPEVNVTPDTGDIFLSI